MSELQVATDTFPIWKAGLWIFYPMTALVMVELLLRGFDDDGGKGVRVARMQPSYAPSPS